MFAAPLAQRGVAGGNGKFAVRWNTVRWLACSAITGTDWIADDPVPMTPTRWPVKSTGSCGQWPV